MKTNKGLWIAIALSSIGSLALLGIAGWFLLFSHAAPVFQYGTLIDPPKPTADFTLASASGTSHALSEFRGKVVLLYFGYTSCPDICPTTLSELKQALQQLGANADQVQVIMVTIDPARDSPDKIAHYVQLFDPRFIGLSGTPDQIAAVAQADGIFYSQDTPDANGNYTMTHYTGVLALNKQGALRLIFPYGTTSDQFAQDVSQLLQE